MIVQHLIGHLRDAMQRKHARHTMQVVSSYVLSPAERSAKVITISLGSASDLPCRSAAPETSPRSQVEAQITSDCNSPLGGANHCMALVLSLPKHGLHCRQQGLV